MLWFVDGSGGQNHLRAPFRTAARFQSPQQRQWDKDHEHSFSSALFSICWIAVLSSPTSRQTMFSEKSSEVDKAANSL